MDPMNQPNPMQQPPIRPEVTPQKQRNLTPVVIVFAILAIIAICLAGFEFYQNTQKDNQITSLEAEKTQTAQTMQQIEQTATEVVQETVTANIEQPADYIYIGEWGIKIKKPENAKNTIAEYSFYNGYPQAVDTFTISEISESKNANVLIGSTTYDCNSGSQAYTACFDIDGVKLVINVSDAVSQNLKTFFTNPANYSKI